MRKLFMLLALLVATPSYGQFGYQPNNFVAIGTPSFNIGSDTFMQANASAGYHFGMLHTAGPYANIAIVGARIEMSRDTTGYSFLGSYAHVSPYLILPALSFKRSLYTSYFDDGTETKGDSTALGFTISHVTLWGGSQKGRLVGKKHNGPYVGIEVNVFGLVKSLRGG